MATVKPFQAVRPRDDLAAKIAALPYDVYSKAEARKVVEENPYSFLKIDRAETQLDEKVDMYSAQVYQRAADTLHGMIREGEFVKEDRPCFYIYELTMDGRTQTGICACASVAEYEHRIIKEHENTRQDKEDDRTRHVDTCRAQTGPIFLTYRYREEIAEIKEEEKKKTPLYDFVSSDGIRHRVWVLDQPETLKRIQNAFSEVKTMYIADGHHRAASAVRVAKMRREAEHRQAAAVGALDLPEYEYFLAVLFADSELLVMDYNRWVKDLAGYETNEFMDMLGEKFTLSPMGKAAHPVCKGQFAMYLDHRWYMLDEKNIKVRKDEVENLDVSILQDEILHPMLKIGNPKTDQRIAFIGGIRGLGELEQRVDQNGGVAFAMYPTSMKELFFRGGCGKTDAAEIDLVRTETPERIADTYDLRNFK